MSKPTKPKLSPLERRLADQLHALREAYLAYDAARTSGLNLSPGIVEDAKNKFNTAWYASYSLLKELGYQ
jgi:hypothetical protein